MWKWVAIFGVAGTLATAQEAGPFAAFAGASAEVLNDPHDLAFGPEGNLYVADKFGNRIVVMDPESLDVIGSIGEGALAGVHDVSFGPDGSLYAAVTGLNGVVVYDLGGGVPENKGLLGPFLRTEGALAHSNGRLYVMASGEGRLYAIEGTKVLAVVGGMPGAHDVAEGPDGAVWVADTVQRRLVKFSPELEQRTVLQGAHFGFAGPRYMDFTEDGFLIVADQDAHRVLKIDPFSGEVLGVIGDGFPDKGPGVFDDPEGVAVRGGAFYFADSDNNRIVKYVVVVN